MHNAMTHGMNVHAWEMRLEGIDDVLQSAFVFGDNMLRDHLVLKHLHRGPI